MALLDFLKNKKETEKAKAKKVSVAKKDVKKSVSAKSSEVAKEEKTVSEKAAPKSNKKVGSFSYSVIKEPHISEKATDLAAKENQYVFEVEGGSGKIEIKKAVEGVYGVKVLSVNIVKIPRKKRRLGKTQGFKKAYTKAIVKIKEGQTIEIL